MDKKTMLWAFYAILTIIGAVIGYYVGKNQKKAFNNPGVLVGIANGLKKFGKYAGAVVGAVVGIIISVILWHTVGKKYSD